MRRLRLSTKVVTVIYLTAITALSDEFDHLSTSVKKDDAVFQESRSLKYLVFTLQAQRCYV